MDVTRTESSPNFRTYKDFPTSFRVVPGWHAGFAASNQDESSTAMKSGPRDLRRH